MAHSTDPHICQCVSCPTDGGQRVDPLFGADCKQNRQSFNDPSRHPITSDQKPAMHALTIEGVRVLFPYDPYDIQLEYMKSVIRCLQQKSNGLLESPTGTGKTLCLLCSALGWLDGLKVAYMDQMLKNRIKSEESTELVPLSIDGFDSGQKLPQILYSSRTHSQLSQACKELKNTAYTSFKTVVIGSRDQLCLNPNVMKLESNWAKNQMCKAQTKSQSCPFYKGYESKVERGEGYRSTQVFDIEDLITLGKKHTCCPYYAARHIKNKASLIFTPYNYILDPQIRSSNSLELKNSIVIFDEGHNIEKMCEESVSSELRSETFAVVIKHLDHVLKILKEIEDKTYEDFDGKEYEILNIVEIAKAKMIICDLEMEVDRLIKSTKANKTSHDTRIIFDIMQKSNCTGTSSALMLGALDKVSSVLNSTKPYIEPQINAVSAALGSLSEFVERLIPIHNSTLEAALAYKADVIKKFKIYTVRGAEDDFKSNSFWNKKTDPNSWVLYLWCMSPSIGAKALIDTGIHSMIITSGTLTPIDSFDVEMGTSFPIKLQNSHIIKGNQLAIFNMSKARDGTILTSKYDNRDNLQYIKALGQALTEVMAVVPKGMLIFFSSYTALNKCVDFWKGSTNIWSKMNVVKQIFLEPRKKETFNECILKYKRAIDENDSGGAAFFAVCRGKLSEGMDLPDDYCRCVIMTGLPFPPVAEPRIILKKQYLTEAKTRLTPDGWYTLQMKRALNQSIGRVVRHKDDFGVIILMDSRFAFMREGLSKWVEKFIHRNRGKEFPDYIRELNEFFTTKCPKFVPKTVPKYESDSQSLVRSQPTQSQPTRMGSEWDNINIKRSKTSKKFKTTNDKTEASPQNKFMSEHFQKFREQFKTESNQESNTSKKYMTEADVNFNRSLAGTSVRSKTEPNKNGKTPPKDGQTSIFDYITID